MTDHLTSEALKKLVEEYETSYQERYGISLLSDKSSVSIEKVSKTFLLGMGGTSAVATLVNTVGNWFSDNSPDVYNLPEGMKEVGQLYNTLVKFRDEPESFSKDEQVALNRLYNYNYNERHIGDIVIESVEYNIEPLREKREAASERLAKTKQERIDRVKNKGRDEYTEYFNEEVERGFSDYDALYAVMENTRFNESSELAEAFVEGHFNSGSDLSRGFWKSTWALYPDDMKDFRNAMSFIEKEATIPGRTFKDAIDNMIDYTYDQEKALQLYADGEGLYDINQLRKSTKPQGTAQDGGVVTAGAVGEKTKVESTPRAGFVKTSAGLNLQKEYNRLYGDEYGRIAEDKKLGYKSAAAYVKAGQGAKFAQMIGMTEEEMIKAINNKDQGPFIKANNREGFAANIEGQAGYLVAALDGSGTINGTINGDIAIAEDGSNNRGLNVSGGTLALGS